MTRTTIAVVVIFICLISDNVSAHHASGGADTSYAGAILTSSASTLQKGRAAMALQSSYSKINDFSDSEMLGYANKGNDVHTFDYLYTVSANIAFGITDDITLGLKLPYSSINNIRETHSDEPDEIHLHGNAEGISDMTVLGKYRFVTRPSQQFESSVLFGLKVPTGNTHKKDKHGERFETEHQPGTGSWDPIIGLAVTRRFGRVTLDADARYTFATEGAQDTDLGDLLNYDLALSYRVPQKLPLDLVIEVNGEWKQKQRIDGTDDENSGEHVMYLSPGIRVTLTRNLSAFISLGFPLVQDLNGIQSKTSYRTVFGIGFWL